MTLADRIRSNAALLDYATRHGLPLTVAHRRALVADMLQMAADADALALERDVMRAEAGWKRRKQARAA